VGEVTGHRNDPPVSENGTKATNGKVSTSIPPAAAIAATGAIGSALISNGAKKQQEKVSVHL